MVFCVQPTASLPPAPCLTACKTFNMFAVTMVPFFFSFLQTIPPELEFDPNLTPPCYRTADSVSV